MGEMPGLPETWFLDDFTFSRSGSSTASTEGKSAERRTTLWEKPCLLTCHPSCLNRREESEIMFPQNRKQWKKEMQELVTRKTTKKRRRMKKTIVVMRMKVEMK